MSTIESIKVLKDYQYPPINSSHTITLKYITRQAKIYKNKQKYFIWIKITSLSFKLPFTYLLPLSKIEKYPLSIPLFHLVVETGFSSNYGIN